MKKTKDYDNAFKTLKTKHRKLFISVINEAFGKNYPVDAKVDLLSPEGFLVDSSKEASDQDIQERINDMLLRIDDDVYLVECQSYDDDSMAIRIAEYSFIAARDNAEFGQGHAELKMPAFTIVYLKATSATPRETSITYSFPDGQSVIYSTQNIFLIDLTKEEIFEKKLYALIPFYIIRYETELSQEKDYKKAIDDLEYIRNKMIQLRQEKQLSDDECLDIQSCCNVVITHITDGNEIEKEVTSVMGGEVFELPSERIRRETKREAALAMIEFGRENNLSDEKIREGLKQKFQYDDEEIKVLFKEIS